MKIISIFFGCFLVSIGLFLIIIYLNLFIIGYSILDFAYFIIRKGIIIPIILGNYFIFTGMGYKNELLLRFKSKLSKK